MQEDSVADFLATATPLLERQDGLITTAQALRCGATPDVLRSLVRRGMWVRLTRGLYGPSGVPMHWRRRYRAAWLLAPMGSLLSHRAAAHLLGAGGFVDPPTPELSIPRNTNLRRDGVIAHESLDLDLASRTVVDGIPCTGADRIAVDIGTVISPSRYVHLLRELRHGQGVSEDRLLRTYLRHKRRGRNGCGALRDWLDRNLPVSGVAESGLEQVVVEALLDAGFTGFELQREVSTAGGRFRLDIAFAGPMIAIEVDGSQHRDRDIAAADVARTRHLEAAGWTVIRIRSDRLASDLADALALLRSVVV